MRLTRVKIFGFKTFAEKTEFSLEGGIVAVVGPNGCGKSNLVDAILWGLGEGSIKHLRASHSQDVIFSGAQGRKAVGYAEVSLCFDNEDGALPIDASEVWITRRLTRGGESDYSINRQSCRQRDILELLADSGLGRAGYAIVGQKEIDQALAASAEDRRAWIDEAAGVQRYRARKVESLRRLSSANNNLVRVSDILAELDHQYEPLKQEAETARRYRQLEASLKEVEIGLLIQDFCKAYHEIGELERLIASSGETLSKEQAHLNTQENDQRIASVQLQRLDEEIETLRNDHQAALTGQERAEANQRILQERLNSLSQQELNLEEDASTLAQRLRESEIDHAEAVKEAAKESEAYDAIKAASTGASTEFDTAQKALDAAEKELSAARERKSLQMKFEAEKEANLSRIRQLKREIDGIDKDMPGVKQSLTDAQAEYDKVAQAVSEVDIQISQQRLIIENTKKEEDEAMRLLRASLSEKATIEGQIRGIEATLDAHEGLSQGSRAVLDAADQGILKGEYVAVGEAVEVDLDYSLAIETALGAAANDLIVKSEHEAKAAVQWLKENRAGRCTFQPLSLMRSQDPSMELRRVLTERGIIGRASELVSVDAKYRPVIESLLGRIVIAEDLDVALHHAKSSGWSRMVTLDGEVIHSSGAVTGGNSQKQGYGIVQRKAELVELEAKLGQIEKRLSGSAKEAQARQRKIDDALAKISALNEQREIAIEPLTEQKQMVEAMEQEERDATRQRARAEQELLQLDEFAGKLIEEINVEEIEQRRDTLLKSFASLSTLSERSGADLIEAQERLRQAQMRQYASEKRLESARGSEANRGKKLEGLAPEKDKLAAEIAKYHQEAETFIVRKNELMVVLTEKTKAKRELSESAMELQEAIRSTRDNLDALTQGSHQHELNRARMETRRATIAERLMDAYALTEQDALAQEGVHEVPSDSQSLVSRLRREIKAMGDVNTGAIEAFEKLDERREAMHAQYSDITEGIKQVEASIAELDKLTRDRFLDTFKAVGEKFSEMFTRLFGGGTAELQLTETQRVLETGVEIEVQLPGKKRQALQLLSGGERSLCASAFLFALLSVKPAPLVVLDEVDAPLDGRNVERFADTLIEFAETIQFIVITHHPTTIAKASNLLGVTMDEPGVSMLIPTKLPEGTEPENVSML